MTKLLVSWLLLAAIGAAALAFLARGQRLATVPLEWRVLVERVRRRFREIDPDLEIVEWSSDGDGNGVLVVDRGGTRLTLPLKDLRDAPPGLFEEKLRQLLVTRDSANDRDLAPELRQLDPGTS